MLLTPNIAATLAGERHPRRTRDRAVRRDGDGRCRRHRSKERNLMRNASQARPRPTVARSRVA